MKKQYSGHPEFYKILEELKEIHSNKNHDYAKKEDPLSNLKMCEAMGIPAWKGVVIRLADKWSRLASYSQKGEFRVNDEGLVDTFKDMATYAILGIILFKEENDKNTRHKRLL